MLVTGGDLFGTLYSPNAAYSFENLNDSHDIVNSIRSPVTHGMLVLLLKTIAAATTTTATTTTTTTTTTLLLLLHK